MHSRGDKASTCLSQFSAERSAHADAHFASRFPAALDENTLATQALLTLNGSSGRLVRQFTIFGADRISYSAGVALA
jgi:hypothetical protein